MKHKYDLEDLFRTSRYIDSISDNDVGTSIISVIDKNITENSYPFIIFEDDIEGKDVNVFIDDWEEALKVANFYISKKDRELINKSMSFLILHDNDMDVPFINNYKEFCVEKTLFFKPSVKDMNEEQFNKALNDIAIAHKILKKYRNY